MLCACAAGHPAPAHTLHAGPTDTDTVASIVHDTRASWVAATAGARPAVVVLATASVHACDAAEAAHADGMCHRLLRSKHTQHTCRRARLPRPAVSAQASSWCWVVCATTPRTLPAAARVLVAHHARTAAARCVPRSARVPVPATAPETARLADTLASVPKTSSIARPTLASPPDSVAACGTCTRHSGIMSAIRQWPGDSPPITLKLTSGRLAVHGATVSVPAVPREPKRMHSTHKATARVPSQRRRERAVTWQSLRAVGALCAHHSEAGRVDS
jgi:hypothetical protein